MKGIRKQKKKKEEKILKKDKRPGGTNSAQLRKRPTTHPAKIPKGYSLPSSSNDRWDPPVGIINPGGFFSLPLETIADEFSLQSSLSPCRFDAIPCL
jgi:hypothetical protein